MQQAIRDAVDPASPIEISAGESDSESESNADSDSKSNAESECEKECSGECEADASNYNYIDIAFGSTYHRENFVSKGIQVRADGSVERRYQCKVNGCNGNLLCKIGDDGTVLNLGRWTRPCCHPPKDAPEKDKYAHLREEIKDLLEKRTPTDVEKVMDERKTPVPLSYIERLNKSVSKDRNARINRIGENEFVDTVCTKRAGEEGLVIVCMDRSLFANLEGGIGAIRTVHIDGTHGIAPRGGQVVTLLTTINDVAVPIGFAVLQGATTANYVSMLERFRDEGLHPTHVLVDFEVAEHNAIATVWPEARIRGCRFHFMQAAFRRWKKNYGSRRTSEWQKVRAFLQRMTECRDEETFTRIATAMSEFLLKAKLKDYLTYFVKQWVERIPPERWTNIDIPIEAGVEATLTRTNNALEGFHNYLKGLQLTNQHMPLELLLDHLQSIQRTRWNRMLASARSTGKADARETIAIAESAPIDALHTWKLARTTNTQAAAPLPITQMPTAPVPPADVQQQYVVRMPRAERDHRPDEDDYRPDEQLPVHWMPPPAAHYMAANQGTHVAQHQVPNLGIAMTVLRWANENGFAIRDVSAEGNCQFDAIGLIIGMPGEQVRANIITFMQNDVNFQNLAGAFLGHDRAGETYAQFVHRMEATNEWGTHITLLAAATLFDMVINVHPGNGGPVMRVEPIGGAAHNRVHDQQMHLVLEDEMHYRAMVPRGDGRDPITRALHNTRNRGKRKKAGAPSAPARPKAARPGLEDTLCSFCGRGPFPNTRRWSKCVTCGRCWHPGCVEKQETSAQKRGDEPYHCRQCSPKW